jgi:hypothetical protein
LATVVSTRSVVVGGEGTRVGERNFWKVEGLLWRYLHEFTSRICNPLVETFAGVLNPRVEMIRITAMELIQEFLVARFQLYVLLQGLSQHGGK